MPWHSNCSNQLAHLQTTGEAEMETSMPTSESAISFDNNVFQAALCHRCGTKIYPAQHMEAHLDRHALKDMYLEGELKKLQYAMGRMR
jgi:hypothetical protein